MYVLPFLIRCASLDHDKVQWISCSLGQFFATIGGDNKLKIWTEDPSQRVTKGRRFRCIYSQSQPNHVSYVSFGFKTIHHDVWLALLTHDGSLALFEPADPESFSSWNQIDQLFPFGQHHRGTEARFRMSFHQSEGPSANALSAGLEPKAISLAISAMSSIKLYRAVKPEEATEGNYQLYEMLHTEIDNALINEIAWAPGCLHPYDIVSVACNDATVRIFHIDTQAVAVTPPQISSYTVQGPTVRRAPSGIGAGLADMSRTTASRQAKANKMNLTHVSKEVAVLSHEEGSPVWKVKWIYDGKQRPFLPFCYANL